MILDVVALLLSEGLLWPDICVLSQPKSFAWAVTCTFALHSTSMPFATPPPQVEGGQAAGDDGDDHCDDDAPPDYLDLDYGERIVWG